MKKLLVSSALVLAMASSAVVAEESGAFVGLGYSSKYTSTGKGDAKIDVNALAYEILGGYKQFFTESFGLRYYAHFQQEYGSTKTGSGKAGTSGHLRYGVNVDALYNFVNAESADFGLFAGARLGLSTQTGTVADAASKDKDYKTTDFVAGLNLGLRGTFAKAHGVELAFHIPLKNHTYLDKGGVKIEDGTRYGANLRYTYSF